MWSKTDSNRIDVLCGLQLVLGYFLHKATKSIHEVINFFVSRNLTLADRPVVMYT